MSGSSEDEDNLDSEADVDISQVPDPTIVVESSGNSSEANPESEGVGTQQDEEIVGDSSESSGSADSSDRVIIPSDCSDDEWGNFEDESDEYWSEEDYFLNEFELLDSQEMENENEWDGGYDDDTEDDDVVILDGPGDELGEGGPGGDGGGDEHESDDEDQETENEADEVEGDRPVGSPPRKVARMDPNPDPGQGTSAAAAAAQAVEDADNDGFTCTICYDQFTNSGEHRISCLKCGHVFGKNCIEKWLKIHGRCPQCNCKAKKGEVRVLYVKSLQAVDNTELTEAKKELEKFQATVSKCNLENTKQKITIDSLTKQLKVVEDQNVQLRQNSSRSASSNMTSCSCNNPGPSRSSNPALCNFAAGSSSLPGSQNQNTVPTSTTPDQPTGRKQLKYTLAKSCDIKEGMCRVGAYNDWLNLMVVSHDMKNSLFPNGCCGIKQINMLELRPMVSMPLHQKQIRDMQFSLCQNDVILTVSMDKKAILYNCAGNVTVQTFQTEYPLWSCVWDEVQTHIFYVGCSNGSIIAYDIRSPQDPLVIYPQGPDKSPVCRLKYVCPAYQANAFNLSGLLIQKLTSVSFGEFNGRNNSEMRFHQLPMEGPFFNVDFEKVSRHLLVSTRPSVRNDANHGSHLLCDLSQYYSETLERNVVTSNVINVYQGSNRDGQKMSRPSLFSPEEGSVYVMANGVQNTVRYWDISLTETNQNTVSNAPDYVLDYVHGRVNSNSFTSLISEKGVRIFNQVFDF